MSNSWENFLFDCYYGEVVDDWDCDLEPEYSDRELDELIAEMRGEDF